MTEQLSKDNIKEPILIEHLGSQFGVYNPDRIFMQDSVSKAISTKQIIN